MPSYVRGLRMNAKSMDFKKMRADLDMLQVLAELDIRTGRKTNEYKEIHAEMSIRQKNTVDKKAQFEVNP